MANQSDEEPTKARPPALFKYMAAERLDALAGWLRCSPPAVLNDVFEMTTNFTAWSKAQSMIFIAPSTLVLIHSNGLYSAVGTIFSAAA